MVNYSKRDKDYLITISLSGIISENEIEALLSTTFNYISSTTIPALYIIDCRHVTFNYTDEVKQRIINFINTNKPLNYMRFSLILSQETLGQIDLFTLNSLQLRPDAALMIFDSAKDALMWCDSPFPALPEPTVQPETPVGSEPQENNEVINVREKLLSGDLSRDEIMKLFLSKEERTLLKENAREQVGKEKTGQEKGTQMKEDSELTKSKAVEEKKGTAESVNADPLDIYFV